LFSSSSTPHSTATLNRPRPVAERRIDNADENASTIQPWYNDHDQDDFVMKKIAAGSFKIHCLAIMDEVQSKRETVVITKRGKPVVKLVPAGQDADDIYNFLAGRGAITGDVVSPAIARVDWGQLK
jgi:prevent-host-death family protein